MNTQNSSKSESSGSIKDVSQTELCQMVQASFELCPYPAFIINKTLEVVLFNKAAVKLSKSAVDNIVNIGPGNIFCCIYSEIGEKGCGSSKYCTDCPTRKSILNVFDTKQNLIKVKIDVSTNDNGVPNNHTFEMSVLYLDTFVEPLVTVYLNDITDFELREQDIILKSKGL